MVEDIKSMTDKEIYDLKALLDKEYKARTSEAKNKNYFHVYSELKRIIEENRADYTEEKAPHASFTKSNFSGAIDRIEVAIYNMCDIALGNYTSNKERKKIMSKGSRIPSYMVDDFGSMSKEILDVFEKWCKKNATKTSPIMEEADGEFESIEK